MFKNKREKIQYDSNPELGNFEVEVSKTEGKDEVEIVPKKDISVEGLVKDEEEYLNSSEREAAIADLFPEGDHDFLVKEIMNTNDKNALFHDPENFIDLLKEKEASMESDDYVDYLDDLQQDIKNGLSILEEKQEYVVERRIVDFKKRYNMPVPDLMLEDELKETAEKVIEEIKYFIENGKKVLEFIEETKVK